MSVRKVYQVIVNSEVVFSGSYASCMSVYGSIVYMNDLKLCSVDVSIAFKPIISKE